MVRQAALMRTGSNPLHGDGLVAALAEFFQDRVEDGPLECFPAASERVVRIETTRTWERSHSQS